MKKKGAGIYFEQYIPAELSGGRPRSSSLKPLEPDSELVASRGVDGTPAASIGNLVGKIVQQLEILFAFDAVRH